MLERFLCSRHIPLPRVLTIELTSHCNLKCVMCPKTAGFVNTRPDSVITMEIIERLEPMLWAVGGVDLSGLWGEAFLHPDLYVSILERLKRRYIGVRTVTNGTLLKRDLAEQLVLLGLDGLEISVDAAKAETYRRLRAGGELEAVIDGVRYLNEYKKKLRRSRPLVKFAFLGMTDNIHELPDFVGMAHDLNVGTVVLQAMGEYASMQGKSVALRDKALGRRWLRQAGEIGTRLGVAIELFPPDQFAENEPAAAHVMTAVPRSKDCFFPWDRAVVTTTGEVLPCCASSRSFGDLKGQSFADIWHGPGYAELRRSLFSGDLPLMCRTCTGQAWRKKSMLDGIAYLSKLEKIRTRQKLRSSPALRKAKNLLKRSGVVR